MRGNEEERQKNERGICWVENQQEGGYVFVWAEQEDGKGNLLSEVKIQNVMTLLRVLRGCGGMRGNCKIREGDCGLCWDEKTRREGELFERGEN